LCVKRPVPRSRLRGRRRPPTWSFRPPTALAAEGSETPSRGTGLTEGVCVCAPHQPCPRAARAEGERRAPPSKTKWSRMRRKWQGVWGAPLAPQPPADFFGPLNRKRSAQLKNRPGDMNDSYQNAPNLTCIYMPETRVIYTVVYENGPSRLHFPSQNMSVFNIHSRHTASVPKL
jgi:hypothetical protein